MTDPNTNCLAGMQCPRCKSLGPFTIYLNNAASRTEAPERYPY